MDPDENTYLTGTQVDDLLLELPVLADKPMPEPERRGLLRLTALYQECAAREGAVDLFVDG